MKYGVLGTGMVGQAIARKLASMGHNVKMGSRTADNEKAKAFADEAGDNAGHGTFDDVAAFAETLFLCVQGAHVSAVLDAINDDHVAGKVLIDLTNPLDFSAGMPPFLSVAGNTSLGEQLQARLPAANVVKTLNTVNCDLMVDPQSLPGAHDMFMCGNDEVAKASVKSLLQDFGWKQVYDLGDIKASRGTESYLPLWLRLWGNLGTGTFNVHVVHNAEAQ